MTDVNPRGWRNRRKVNAAKQAEFAEARDVRLARQGMYDAEAEAGRASAISQAAVDAQTTCSCPICAGTGAVTVSRAAAAVEAWGQYHFHGYSPSKAVLESYGMMARGEPVPAAATTVNFLYGTTPPIIDGSHRPAAVPETVAPVAVEPEKPRPTRNTKPVPMTHDGFIIDED